MRSLKEKGNKGLFFTPIQSREINDLLNQIEGWKKAKSSLRFGKDYGTQRAYVRRIGVNRIEK